MNKKEEGRRTLYRTKPMTAKERDKKAEYANVRYLESEKGHNEVERLNNTRRHNVSQNNTHSGAERRNITRRNKASENNNNSGEEGLNSAQENNNNSGAERRNMRTGRTMNRTKHMTHKERRINSEKGYNNPERLHTSRLGQKSIIFNSEHAAVLRSIERGRRMTKEQRGPNNDKRKDEAANYNKAERLRGRLNVGLSSSKGGGNV